MGLRGLRPDFQGPPEGRPGFLKPAQHLQDQAPGPEHHAEAVVETRYPGAGLDRLAQLRPGRGQVPAPVVDQSEQVQCLGILWGGIEQSTTDPSGLIQPAALQQPRTFLQAGFVAPARWRRSSHGFNPVFDQWARLRGKRSLAA